MDEKKSQLWKVVYGLFNHMDIDNYCDLGMNCCNFLDGYKDRYLCRLFFEYLKKENDEESGTCRNILRHYRCLNMFGVKIKC